MLFWKRETFFATTALSVGSHTITADFTGTNGWLNSSGAIPQVVQQIQADAQVLLMERE